MTDHPTPTVQLILIVDDEASVAESLAIALESIGAASVQMNRTADARLVIEGAPGLTAVMSRCTLDPIGEQPFLAWVSDRRPDVALVALCAGPGHSHDDFPRRCQFLSPPFDGQDMKRALIEARLSASENWRST